MSIWILLTVLYVEDVPFGTKSYMLDQTVVKTAHDCAKQIEKARKAVEEGGFRLHAECREASPPAPPPEPPKPQPKGDPATERRS